MILPLGLLALAAGAVARRAATLRRERALAARMPVGADGIIPGARPISLTGRSRAVLMLHGFGDTPQTLHYLADHLHARGFTVEAPLLPGHGRTLAAFSASGSEEWLGAAREALAALRRTHRDVALLGLSMGGALATILAVESPAPTALVLLAPYLGMPSGVRRVAGAHRLIGMAMTYVSGGGSESIRDPAEKAQNLAYGACTPALLHELRTVVDRAERALPDVRVPTLLVQSSEDNRISRAVAEGAFARLGASEKRLVWTSGQGHIITVDLGRERVFEIVHAWLEAHPAGASEVATKGATDTI